MIAIGSPPHSPRSASTTNLEIDHWPIEFAAARFAIHWADTFLREPKLDSQMGKITHQHVEAKQLRLMCKQGEVITRHRLQDMAETLSCALSQVPAPQGPAYRAVFGVNHDTLGLADQLAHIVWDGPDGGKTIAGMRDAALLLLEAERIEQRFGSRMYVSTIAYNMRTSKRTYYRRYHDYFKLMRTHLHNWLDRADRHYSEILANIGVL